MNKFLEAKYFYHLVDKNRDGTPKKWKRNGKVKLWKTRPTDFKIPVKNGLGNYGYIDHTNFHEFRVSNFFEYPHPFVFVHFQFLQSLPCAQLLAFHTLTPFCSIP